MFSISSRQRGVGLAALCTLLVGSSLALASSSQAATLLDGPIDLGTAASFGVLGASAVTNTHLTTVDGDVGVSPDSAVSGFDGPPDGSFTGSLYTGNAAATPHDDLGTAYNAASSLTPIVSGLANLTSMRLVPGVYSGGALSIDGAGSLTLIGDDTDVWVFQADSTLITGSASHIDFVGTANACNVFWRVGSSATLGTYSDFAGTILAHESITATTGATIAGRLLADTAAVTLDTNTITVPDDCTAGTAPVESDSPAITSPTPPDSTVGTPYDFTVTASGTPAPAYTVTSGALPDGLTLNGTTGQISGTPTRAADYSVAITASNGTAPDVTSIYTLRTVAAPTPAETLPVPGAPLTATPTPTPMLAETGYDYAPGGMLTTLLIGSGLLLLLLRRRTVSDAD